MANGNFGGGDGTIGNPYLIEDYADFNKIRDYKSSHFKQVNDIKGKEMRSLDFNSAGVNTGPFTGTYDGDGYILEDFDTLIYYERIIQDDRGFPINEDANDYLEINSIFGSWLGEFKNATLESFYLMYGNVPTLGGIFHTVNASNIFIDGSDITFFGLGSHTKIGGFCYSGNTRFVRGSLDITATDVSGRNPMYDDDNIGGIAGYCWTGTHSDVELELQMMSQIDAFGFGGENLDVTRCCVAGEIALYGGMLSSPWVNFPPVDVDTRGCRLAGFCGSSMPGNIEDCFTYCLLSGYECTVFGFSARSYTSRAGVKGLIKNSYCSCGLYQIPIFSRSTVSNKNPMYFFTKGSPGKNHCDIVSCLAMIPASVRSYTDDERDYVAYSFHKDVPAHNLINCYSYNEGLLVVTDFDFTNPTYLSITNSNNVSPASIRQLMKKQFYIDLEWDMESVWFFSNGSDFGLPMLIYRSPYQEWGVPGTHFMNYIYVLPHVGGSANYMGVRWKYQFSFHTYPMPFAQGRTGDEVNYEVGNLHHRIYDPYQEKEVDAVFIFSGIRDFKGPGGFAYYTEDLKRTTFVKDNMAATVNFYFTDASLLPESSIRKVKISTPNGVVEILVYDESDYSPIRFRDSDGTICSLAITDVEDIEMASDIRVMTEDGIGALVEYFETSGIEMFYDDLPPVGGA